MICGERIVLRALEERDVEQLRLWRNHPELIGYHCSDIPVSQISQARWYENCASNPKQILFIIEDEENNRIGYTLIKNLDHKNRNAEIGLHLDPSAQGKGYGKEAFQTLIQYCFNELNLHRLYLEVFDFNERAIKLYETLGFQTDGRMREAYFTQGAYCDILIMSLLENENLQ